MMLIRCNLVKGTDEAKEFEDNYKDSTIRISKMLFAGGVIFITDKSWDEFKKLVDGNNVVWSDVKLREDPHNYELWLEVEG